MIAQRRGYMISKSKLSDKVADYIEDKIITGEYKGGDRLVETKVAKELGISQAPVREALRDLELIGLVEVKPYNGTYILPISEKTLEQVFSLRTLLECFAVEQGIQHITDDMVARLEEKIHMMEKAANEKNAEQLTVCDIAFHEILVNSADNFMLNRLWNIVGVRRWTFFTINKNDYSYFPKSHLKLLEYAKQRDASKLSDELKNHFNKAKEFNLRITQKLSPE